MVVGVLYVCGWWWCGGTREGEVVELHRELVLYGCEFEGLDEVGE